ncbi:immunity 70 family protein [Sutcliffiella horikoshii]|uniref:immunity 70 family protein n=1 Tax=Sutcliffiella horikoshii TaxID=79883 RepID=UPI00385123B4
MSVGLLVDCFHYELGPVDFVHSFFSTVSYHLEKEGWGTKYPELMKKLYHDKLEWEEVTIAKRNLLEIERELSALPTEKVIWDIEDLSKTPPGGDRVSPNVTNLANYFATTKGKTFFEVMNEVLDIAIEDKCDIRIKQI